MARTKTFDPTRALDRALDLFWERGYSATSLHDLLAHMGISRQSLYDTYGDKQQLFLAALDRYCATRGAEPLTPMRAGGPVRAALAEVLCGLVQEAEAGERRGCFLVNTAVECAPHDAAIAAKVRGGVCATEDVFATAIRHGQQTGELSATADPVVLARYLMTFLQGLRVQAKVAPNPALLYPVIDLALAQLG